MAVKRYGKSFFFATTVMLSGLHVQNWVAHDASFHVQQVVVKGNVLLSTETIIKTAQVPQGERTFRINVSEIEARLATLPFVQEVQVSRVYPATVTIWVKEQEPVALLNHKGLWPLAADGEVLPQVEAGVRLDLPVVTGAALDPASQGRRLTAAGVQLCDFIRTLRQHNPLMYHDISEFHLQPEGGLILYLYSYGVPVYVGRQDWFERCERLDTVLRQLPAHGGRLAAIDLRFENQVVTRVAG
ncbi:MAG: FtsQ-type POTRA domain-containing protein [candidate division KSB1 bacterium]|nr:FtsQ-type POTRA domain-containing protein [candidate division KSB1 bacterium]MDZ7272447.1 FtsQ-type POTRA domain-containing protein [candidate division KSB1 bacterium]MDZ7284529.1 FtsQ-type POTRA domain-containing protein [candidate division KSB1 bacterium]MDZ7297075.1 FtsQ-type POTRA domain-containing protein [candidate division KSB1 bacterium]MDZ7308162.1 FtsQ-type POTRA domain-containing protein [candidate division KSB1 bacterium]